MHASVVGGHISMYAWHICFYPSIIAASAVPVDVNYSKEQRAQSEEEQVRYNRQQEINYKAEYFRFSSSVPVIGQLFP